MSKPSLIIPLCTVTRGVFTARPSLHPIGPRAQSFGTEAGKTIAAAETGNVFGAAYGAYKTYKARVWVT